MLNLHIPFAMNKFVENKIARRMLEIAKGFMSADVVSLWINHNFTNKNLLYILQLALANKAPPLLFACRSYSNLNKVSNFQHLNLHAREYFHIIFMISTCFFMIFTLKMPKNFLRDVQQEILIGCNFDNVCYSRHNKQYRCFLMVLATKGWKSEGKKTASFLLNFNIIFTKKILIYFCFLNFHYFVAQE